MDINELTIAQVKEVAKLFGNHFEKAQTTVQQNQETQEKNSAYEIGGLYMFRTVTHIVTGRLLSVHKDGMRVTDAAWIADTGRFTQAVASGDFNEVEPYPDGCIVVVNTSAMIDATKIPRLPRTQK